MRGHSRTIISQKYDDILQHLFASDPGAHIKTNTRNWAKSTFLHANPLSPKLMSNREVWLHSLEQKIIEIYCLLERK